MYIYIYTYDIYWLLVDVWQRTSLPKRARWGPGRAVGHVSDQGAAVAADLGLGGEGCWWFTDVELVPFKRLKGSPGPQELAGLGFRENL